MNASNAPPVISLQSFLQIIELDEVSCNITLYAKEGEERGILYFTNGKLIDAQCGSIGGIDAAYILCGDNGYTFSVDPPVDRSVNISKSLAHVLMYAAALSDDRVQPDIESSSTVTAKPVVTLQELVDFLDASKGVEFYMLFNNTGKMIVQSRYSLAKNLDNVRGKPSDKQVRSLVTACALDLVNRSTGEELPIIDCRHELDDGRVVVALPYVNTVLGLFLSQSTEMDNITAFLGIPAEK
jgi:hypothetical protein